MRPTRRSCHTPWRRGTVTNITNTNQVEVDGTPFHLNDVRRAEIDDQHEGDAESDGSEITVTVTHGESSSGEEVGTGEWGEKGNIPVARRRPVREVRRPVRYGYEA